MRGQLVAYKSGQHNLDPSSMEMEREAYVADHLRPKENHERPGHFVCSRRKVHNGVFNSGAVTLGAAPFAIRDGTVDGVC